MWPLILSSAFSATPDVPGEALPIRHWDEQHLDLNVRVDPDTGTVRGEGFLLQPTDGQNSPAE